jgi:hypothetical protein
VTSSFPPIPFSWATLPNLQLVASVDGLQEEHDVRRRHRASSADAMRGKLCRNLAVGWGAPPMGRLAGIISLK